VKTALPFVFLNVAITADGKIAPSHRPFVPFGSRHDQVHLYELRAQADAVMSGAGTLNSTQIKLGPGAARYRRERLRRGLAEYNLRVIVSGAGRIDPRTEIFRHRFSPIIVLTTERAGANRLRQLQRVADEVRVCGEREIDFAAALRWLRHDWGVKRLLSEGGGELNGALFHAGLVNELHITLCPLIFGGHDAPTLADGVGVATLDDATALVLKSCQPVGQELFLIYRVIEKRRLT
jgi:2,5-diamino-6-(ribosylamino)-4(3H)-pyrimidinone 5'-phosphate reductase